MSDPKAKLAPFTLTKEEQRMLDKNYKKPKRKHRQSQHFASADLRTQANAAATAAASTADSAAVPTTAVSSSTPATVSFGHIGQQHRRRLRQQRQQLQQQQEEEASRLSGALTVSSRLKVRMSDEMDEIWTEIEEGSSASSADGGKGGEGDDDETEEEEELDEEEEDGSSPTYAMACLKRATQKCRGLEEFVSNSREMFLLQFSVSVKQEERLRLEKVLRQEEAELQTAEAELRLAQQAFDQFLQECDRGAIQAQKRAENETNLRMEKTADIQEADNSIVALKREIFKLRDQLIEYGTLESFLYSLSPEAWRQVIEQKDKEEKERRRRRSSGTSVTSATSTSATAGTAGTWTTTGSSEQEDEERVACLQAAAGLLGIMAEDFGKVGEDVRLYFGEPQQLLSIFTDLEDENLRLIEQCQEAEDKLEAVKRNAKETKARLNEQAGKFDREISRLEMQIEVESKVLTKLEVTAKMQSIKERKLSAVTGGGFRKAVGGKVIRDKRAKVVSEEDKMLDDLELIVSRVHASCVGEARSRVSTLDKLKRIELRMETLTKELELLPEEKVNIAQKTCEKERRHREDEARVAEHKRLLAERNQRALNRAMVPTYVKPELRRFQPPVDLLIRRKQRLRRLKAQLRSQQAREEEDDDNGGAAVFRGDAGGGTGGAGSGGE